MRLYFFICTLIIFTSHSSRAQQKRMTEAERKILVTNFNTVLADVKNDFKSIATGDMKEWQGRKASASKVQLLPSYYELDKIYSIYYGVDDINKNENSNYFLDISPFSIGEMYAALSATLKVRGFVEVQPQRAEAIDSIRAFRSKDAVVVFKGAKDMIDKKTNISIGKFYYYYGANVLTIKSPPAIKNKNEFTYQHPCGLRASGKYIAGDTLIEGKIIYCTNTSDGPASFTGTYVNKGYLPRTYIGNASGNMPMKFEMIQGQLDFAKWGVAFTGDFSAKVFPNTVIAKGYLKVNNDSVLGFLHDNRGYDPSFIFTPVDKNKKRVRFYSDYQGSKSPKLIYENNTVGEEEKEWADIEQRIKNRQNNTANGSSGNSGSNNSSPAAIGMVNEATAARMKLYDWMRASDKAMEADVLQCAKDRGFGAGIARMSGHCKRAAAYFKQHNDKCYDYLKKYEKFTPAEQVSDIKSRVKAVIDASKGMQ